MPLTYINLPSADFSILNAETPRLTILYRPFQAIIRVFINITRSKSRFLEVLEMLQRYEYVRIITRSTVDVG